MPSVPCTEERGCYDKQHKMVHTIIVKYAIVCTNILNCRKKRGNAKHF